MGKGYIWKYTSDSLRCPECPHLLCGMEMVMVMNDSRNLRPVCLDCCTEEIRLSIRSQKAQDLVKRRERGNSGITKESEK